MIVAESYEDSRTAVVSIVERLKDAGRFVRQTAIDRLAILAAHGTRYICPLWCPQS